MEIRHDVDLAPHNSFGITAYAAQFVVVENPTELPAVFQHAQSQNLRVLILGSGSNILFVNDFPGLVLHMSNTGIEFDEASGRVRAAAGENWHQFVSE